MRDSGKSQVKSSRIVTAACLGAGSAWPPAPVPCRGRWQGREEAGLGRASTAASASDSESPAGRAAGRRLRSHCTCSDRAAPARTPCTPEHQAQAEERGQAGAVAAHVVLQALQLHAARQQPHPRQLAALRNGGCLQAPPGASKGSWRWRQRGSAGVDVVRLPSRRTSHRGPYPPRKGCLLRDPQQAAGVGLPRDERVDQRQHGGGQLRRRGV